MAELPRLQRIPDDPWLTARLRAATGLAQAELALIDALRAAQTAAYETLWRVMLDTVTDPPLLRSLLAAGPPDEGAFGAAQRAWLDYLGFYVQPVLADAFGARWRAIVGQSVLSADPVRRAILLSVHNRLVETYWRQQLARIERSLDPVFGDIRRELLAAQAAGEGIPAMRDRVARVLQIDATSRALRAEAQTVEARLFNTALSDRDRARLFARRERALHTMFEADGRTAVARGKLRLAASLESRARTVALLSDADPEPARLTRRARELRAEARRVAPPASMAQRARDTVDRIDNRLFRNPDLPREEVRTLRARRAELYRAARADESRWAFKARRIARTEAVGAYNGGTWESARAVADVLGERRFKRWLATTDSRVRDTHWRAHGQTVPMEGDFLVGGAKLKYPGDPYGPGKEVINCRCALIVHTEVEAVRPLYPETA